MKLEVQLRNEGPYQPGQAVRGGVKVLEGGRSRSLSVSLQYIERSPAFTHTAVEIPGGVLNTGDLQSGAWFEFSIPMPADALPGQDMPHGRLYWQVDAKSDEAGPDTHAYAEVPTGQAAAQAGTPASPSPAPTPVTATDPSGTPLLAPGYSARAAEGRPAGQTARAVLTIILGIAVLGFGIYQVVDAFSDDESTTTTVPIYNPQPPISTPGSSFDLFECYDQAGNDPIARTECIREHNRRIDEGTVP